MMRLRHRNPLTADLGSSFHIVSQLRQGFSRLLEDPRTFRRAFTTIQRVRIPLRATVREILPLGEDSIFRVWIPGVSTTRNVWSTTDEHDSLIVMVGEERGRLPTSHDPSFYSTTFVYSRLFTPQFPSRITWFTMVKENTSPFKKSADRVYSYTRYRRPVCQQER